MKSRPWSWRRARATLRHTGRRSLAATLPPALRARRAILISGLPRSGTSWLAKALSLGSGVSYYFESDSVLPASYRYLYLPPDTADPVLHEHIVAALRGTIRTEYVLAEQDFAAMLRAPFAHTIMHKWVKFPLNLAWIQQHFPELLIVQIVRHPVPLFLSWKQRDWDPAWTLGELLKQSALMDGPLQPLASRLRAASTPLQKAAGFWAAVTTMQLASCRPQDVLCEHEWYCLDPVPRIRWLCDRIGLEFNARTEAFISPHTRRGAGPGYGRARDPRSEVHKWRDAVTDAELNEIRAFLQDFELPFYPDLAPDAFPSLGDDGRRG